MPKALVSLLLFVLLAAGCALGFRAAVRDRMLNYPAELQLVSARGVKPPARVQAELAERLAAEPLNVGVFNVFYVSQVHQGVAEDRRDAMVNVLGDLGWRHSSAQRNLIFEAVRRNDLEMALLRADGLLRRDKMTEYLLPVMRQMETDENATGLLITRLSRFPNWRQPYFGDVRSLEDSGARAARQALLERMISENQPLSRVELKHSLDAFVRWDEPERAASVVRLQNPRGDRSTLNIDPQFAQAGGLMGDDHDLPLPMEWEMSTRRGVSARVEGMQEASRLSLHWNGSGSPELARQLVAIGGSRALGLEVILDDDQDLRALPKIGFQWSCRHRRSIPFLPVTELSKDKRLTLLLDGTPQCSFGYLRIVGLPQSADQPVDIAFKLIALKAQ